MCKTLINGGTQRPSGLRPCGSESGSLGLNFAGAESRLLIGGGAAAVPLGPAEHAAQGLHAAHFETYPEGGGPHPDPGRGQPAQ